MKKELREEIPVNREDLPEWAHFQASLSQHPIVRIEGVLRYKVNPMMRWLSDHVDLNEMWIAYRQGAWDRDTFMQFYRDIGYSLGGFEEIWGEDLDEMEETAGKKE